MQSIPLHAYDLIALLDAEYPEVDYDPGMNRDELLMRFGERRLIRHLLFIKNREMEEQTSVPR